MEVPLLVQRVRTDRAIFVSMVLSLAEQVIIVVPWGRCLVLDGLRTIEQVYLLVDFVACFQLRGRL